MKTLLFRSYTITCQKLIFIILCDMMLFLYFAFWVTYQCISLLEEVSYVLCDSFINVLFSIPDLVQKPALQMAQEHANPDQWNAHAAAKTAAEGAIHTAHYEPANAPGHAPTQYHGTANTAHYAANTAHYEPANAPVHAATQYHGTANTAHYEPANGRRHAAANFIDRPNTIAEAESLKRTQCCMLKIRKYSTIIRQFLYSNGAGDRSRDRILAIEIWSWVVL